MLNHQSPVPLYHQLAKILTAAIESGEFAPGTRIAPEVSLAATHGIGRPTVRQAIDVLVKRGLVQRKRGAGTFVLARRRQVDLFSLAGTSSAFEQLGIAAEKRIIDPICLATVVDDSENPFAGNEAYQFSRLTLAEQAPVLIEDFFLHKSLFSGIETMVIAGVSLARVVADRFYLKPVNGRQTFKVATLSPRRAGLLEIDSRDPVLEVRRAIDFPDVENGVYSKIFCRTDKFSFSQTLGGHSND
jgi:GntR family transcriptional regulator